MRAWLPATGRPRVRGGDALPPTRCSVLEPVRSAPGYQVKTYYDGGYNETPWARVLCGANQLGLFVLMMRVTRRFRPPRRRAVSTRAATRGRGDTPRRGLRPRWRVCTSETCGVRGVATRYALALVSGPLWITSATGTAAPPGSWRAERVVCA